MGSGGLPPPNWPGETQIEREERRLTGYLPLAISVAISALLALLWHLF